MTKKIPLVAIFLLIVGIGVGILGSKMFLDNSKTTTTNELPNNSEIKDGIQYITITAQGGYLPRASNAKAGIPTKLIVKTNGTYDCSTSLVIRSLSFQKILAPTGEEIIDIGIPEVGKQIEGLCGMGMYSFLINFI